MSAPSRGLLFETARGRVRRCLCCDRLELRFGNALLAFGAGELPDVLGALGTADTAASADRREVTLCFGDGGCGWVFTPDEAAELRRLLAGARLMLDLATAT